MVHTRWPASRCAETSVAMTKTHRSTAGDHANARTGDGSAPSPTTFIVVSPSFQFDAISAFCFCVARPKFRVVIVAIRKFPRNAIFRFRPSRYAKAGSAFDRIVVVVNHRHAQNTLSRPLDLDGPRASSLLPLPKRGNDCPEQLITGDAHLWGFPDQGRRAWPIT